MRWKSFTILYLLVVSIDRDRYNAARRLQYRIAVIDAAIALVVVVAVAFVVDVVAKRCQVDRFRDRRPETLDCVGYRIGDNIGDRIGDAFRDAWLYRIVY